MQKLMLLLTVFFLMLNTGNAQLKRTWKRQIYGGLSRTVRNENLSRIDNYDINFVSKSNWLFNGGLTFSKYRSKLDIPASSGFNIASMPMTTFRQINLSIGRRVDFSPKWGLSLYSGLSYTHCEYPTIAYGNSMKYGVYVPITLSYISATYETKQSIGLHLNSELNFYVCDNIMLYASYMYDINAANQSKGFFLGGRFGLMKQKNGTRRISSYARI